MKTELIDEKSKRCSGIRTSGYWKGYPCGATPKYKKGDKWYCKNHFPLEAEYSIEKAKLK